MTYRDEIDALATYRTYTKSAAERRDEYRRCPRHLLGGDYAAMLLGLAEDFEAKAAHAAAYLSAEQQKDAA